MSDSHRRDLSPSKRQSKERILAQADPAKIRKSSSSLVFTQGGLILLTDERGRGDDVDVQPTVRSGTLRVQHDPHATQWREAA